MCVLTRMAFNANFILIRLKMKMKMARLRPTAATCSDHQTRLVSFLLGGGNFITSMAVAAFPAVAEGLGNRPGAMAEVLPRPRRVDARVVREGAARGALDGLPVRLRRGEVRTLAVGVPAPAAARSSYYPAEMAWRIRWIGLSVVGVTLAIDRSIALGIWSYGRVLGRRRGDCCVMRN